jgi:hypothetical protein
MQLIENFCKTSNFRRRDSATAHYLRYSRHLEYHKHETGKETVNFFKECAAKNQELYPEQANGLTG